MKQADRGPILIADITGYSAFLNESELVHAEQTLSALLELLVEQTRPPLVVSKLEGDAVLSYGLEGSVLRGQAFTESLEACYVEFRRAIELMVLNTSCTCNACANIGGLDLKFFVHHGEFVLGEVAGTTELHGSDVNLIHRLLKNTVTRDTEITAYIMYTRQAVESLDLGELTEAFTAHTDTYSDVGEVSAWVEDLGPVWDRARQQRIEIDPRDVLLEISTDIDLPVEMVWSYLIDPEYRTTLIGSTRQEVQTGGQGRIGEGSVYQCYHGEKLSPHLVVDWRPLERIVTSDTLKVLGMNLEFPSEYALERMGSGTRLTRRGMVPDGPWLGRRLARFAYPRMTNRFQRGIEAFRDRIEAEDRSVSSAVGTR